MHTMSIFCMLIIGVVRDFTRKALTTATHSTHACDFQHAFLQFIEAKECILPFRGFRIWPECPVESPFPTEERIFGPSACGPLPATPATLDTRSSQALTVQRNDTPLLHVPPVV